MKIIIRRAEARSRFRIYTAKNGSLLRWSRLRALLEERADPDVREVPLSDSGGGGRHCFRVVVLIFMTFDDAI